jgi:DNA polymerase
MAERIVFSLSVTPGVAERQRNLESTTDVGKEVPECILVILPMNAALFKNSSKPDLWLVVPGAIGSAWAQSLDVRPGNLNLSGPAASNQFDIRACFEHAGPAMADVFQQLLDSTIHYLEDLQRQGRHFVSATPETLRELRNLKVSRPIGSGASGATARPPSTPAKPPPPVAPSVAREPAASSPPAPDAAKEAMLAGLRERALVCTRCPNLVKSRKQVVFGAGNSNAELMFVGEAPGADEDAQGEPFVGRAGQLLTKIIETMGLSRGTVYIGNILKCRPDMPAAESGNRKPTLEEMETCMPWLLEQIEIIKPKVLVALGATALEGLIGGTVKITHLRGQWKEFKGIPLMPTFHPSYLIRGNDIHKKRQVWEDMLQVMEKLGMPVSDKQRGFFLKR